MLTADQQQQYLKMLADREEYLVRRLNNPAPPIEGEWVDKVFVRSSDPAYDSSAISHELRQIGEIREKVSLPEFGICHDCGKLIPFLRLLAAPIVNSHRCVGCCQRFGRSAVGKQQTFSLIHSTL